MFIKRYLNSKREKIAVVTQIVLPLLMVLFGLLLSLSQDSQQDDQKRLMSLSMLNDKADDKLSAYYSDLSDLSSISKMSMEQRDMLKQVCS